MFMCRMQETAAPQTACKVPPSKGRKWKQNHSYLPQGKGEKEGGRHTPQMNFRQLAVEHSACEGHKYNWSFQQRRIHSFNYYMTMELKKKKKKNLITALTMCILSFVHFNTYCIFFSGTWNLKKWSSLYQLTLQFFSSPLGNYFPVFLFWPKHIRLSFLKKKNSTEANTSFWPGLSEILNAHFLNNAKWIYKSWQF